MKYYNYVKLKLVVHLHMHVSAFLAEIIFAKNIDHTLQKILIFGGA